MNRILGLFSFLALNTGLGCDPGDGVPVPFLAGCYEFGGTYTCDRWNPSLSCAHYTCTYTRELRVCEYSIEVEEGNEGSDASVGVESEHVCTDGTAEAGAEVGLGDGGIDASVLVPDPAGRALRRQPRSTGRSL